MNARRHASQAFVAMAFVAAGCQGQLTGRLPGDRTQATPTPVGSLPGHEQLTEDTTPKSGPRLMPAETYVRSYMSLFGGLAPLAIQSELSHDALFDAWDNYMQVLGLPDYRADIARGTQTNALMMAAFERLGVALCDRAVLHDLRRETDAPAPVVFTFDAPTGALTEDAFAPRFEVLHRRFLGYPTQVAPTTDRVGRFYALYQQAADNQAHPQADGGAAAATAFSPAEAGWAAVCYGLVRHPEFHVY